MSKGYGRAGRPPKVTAAMVASIKAYLTEHRCTIIQACKAHGITARHFYRLSGGEVAKQVKEQRVQEGTYKRRPLPDLVLDRDIEKFFDKEED